MAELIEVFGPDGNVEVEAHPTPVPGLVINYSLGVPGTFNITHAPSGTALALSLPDPEYALHVAIEMGKVTDWTQAGTSLRSDPAVEEGWNRVLDETGASNYWGRSRTVPDSDLASREAGAS